jgi:hypothetical protein
MADLIITWGIVALFGVSGSLIGMFVTKADIKQNLEDQKIRRDPWMNYPEEIKTLRKNLRNWILGFGVSLVWPVAFAVAVVIVFGWVLWTIPGQVRELYEFAFKGEKE